MTSELDLVSGLLDTESSEVYIPWCGEDHGQGPAQSGADRPAAARPHPGAARRGGRRDQADGRRDRGRRLRAVGVPGAGGGAGPGGVGGGAVRPGGERGQGVNESRFVRWAGVVGDLGSPFLAEERQRDVWNEASAVGL